MGSEPRPEGEGVEKVGHLSWAEWKGPYKGPELGSRCARDPIGGGMSRPRVWRPQGLPGTGGGHTRVSKQRGVI